jgi:hypothetical protein
VCGDLLYKDHTVLTLFNLFRLAIQIHKPFLFTQLVYYYSSCRLKNNTKWEKISSSFIGVRKNNERTTRDDFRLWRSDVRTSTTKKIQVGARRLQ